MAKSDNILGQQAVPLFFKVGNVETLGFAAPSPRLGQAVRLAVRSLSMMQKEALVVNSRTGDVWRLTSDEGAYLDGHNEAPCPLSFLSSGMVASYMTELLALAAERNVDLGRVRIVQDNFYTMKGSASEGTMTGGAKDVDLDVAVERDVDPGILRNLVHDAVAASPLNGLMRGVKESLFALSHNGTEIGAGRARPVESGLLADPGETFDRMEAAPGDWSDLIDNTGEPTPPNENTATFAGGSLVDRQDRLLHVRVVAEMRDDGIKEITQSLFNPHGTIFRFRSDEEGRAPDAASLIAAGIGFCFMTQFGRYANIVGKTFRDYRILQDAHFSPGGASGATGKAGTAAPLETHCYLFSDEDDGFARKALDMAEQTCFLHAFCRTDLKARVRVSRLTDPQPV